MRQVLKGTRTPFYWIFFKYTANRFKGSSALSQGRAKTNCFSPEDTVIEEFHQKDAVASIYPFTISASVEYFDIGGRNVRK